MLILLYFLQTQLQMSCVLNSCCVRKNFKKMVCYAACYILLSCAIYCYRLLLYSVEIFYMLLLYTIVYIHYYHKSYFFSLQLRCQLMINQ